MAERARPQRVKPIVRQGSRPEKPLDHVQRVGTEVPHSTRGATDAKGQLFIHSKALESYPEAASAAASFTRVGGSIPIVADHTT